MKNPIAIALALCALAVGAIDNPTYGPYGHAAHIINFS